MTDQGQPQEPRWLSAADQCTWRKFHAVVNMLPQQLERELQQQHGLTLHDYEILVRLSEAEERRMRLSELAERSCQSKSRLSHQMSRMENAGLVARESCPTDRRGSFAVLTDKGWEVLRAAAPDHVEGVRRHFMDLLTDEQKTVLNDVFGTVYRHLDPDGGAC